jgi:D-alanyl-D-alanine carboxypeptidase/D-alanyl-D-alanine-endopeptidase (penicillin-binding protein 4)
MKPPVQTRIAPTVPQLSRRRVVAGLLGLAAGVVATGPVQANAPLTSLRPVPRPERVVMPDGTLTARALEELIAEAQLGGDLGFAARSLDTGARIEEFAAETPMPPASVAKALTAVYALDTLGPDHRFATRVLATAPVVDGTLDGDLILVGGGDPTLETDDLGGLAERMRATGLRRVTGRFLVFGGALPTIPEIDALQPPQVGYNPTISGLMLNFNRVFFEWTRTGGGWQLGLDARGVRYRPSVSMARIDLVDRATPVYTFATDGQQDRWTVAQSALGNGGGRWLPVRQPDAYCGDVFRSIAVSLGVSMPAPQVVDTLPPTGNGVMLAEHRSGPLIAIIEGMLRYSTNLTAEAVGLAASLARAGQPATLVASAGMMSDWARQRFGLRDVALVDHSGLGDRSRISAADLVRFLGADPVRAILTPVLRDHTMRDRNGAPMSDHPIAVQAKTGTLNFVSALAGYATLRDGRAYAFAVMTANLTRRDALTEHERERPPGGSAWAGRSRVLQQALIERWGVLASS